MRTAEIKKKARNILGVSEQADINIIRDAYRELAKKYHPDRNSEDQSLPDKFILITEAYEILCGDKNARSYGILKDQADQTYAPACNERSYWEWWKERFGDFF